MFHPFFLFSTFLEISIKYVFLKFFYHEDYIFPNSELSFNFIILLKFKNIYFSIHKFFIHPYFIHPSTHALVLQQTHVFSHSNFHASINSSLYQCIHPFTSSSTKLQHTHSFKDPSFALLIDASPLPQLIKPLLQSNTHLFIHQSIYSFIFLLTFTLTHSLFHPLIFSFFHINNHSFIQSFIHLFIYSLILSLIPRFIHSFLFLYLLTRATIHFFFSSFYLFILLSMHPIVPFLPHPLIHSSINIKRFKL